MRIDATTQMTKPMAIRGRDCVAKPHDPSRRPCEKSGQGLAEPLRDARDGVIDGFEGLRGETVGQLLEEILDSGGKAADPRLDRPQILLVRQKIGHPDSQAPPEEEQQPGQKQNHQDQQCHRKELALDPRFAYQPADRPLEERRHGERQEERQRPFDRAGHGKDQKRDPDPRIQQVDEKRRRPSVRAESSVRNGSGMAMDLLFTRCFPLVCPQNPKSAAVLRKNTRRKTGDGEEVRVIRGKTKSRDIRSISKHV